MGAMIILIVFLLCVFTSVPIGFSIGLSVVAYALATGSVNMGYIASGLFASCDSFPLMAIPFFILSGALMEGGGLSKRLVLFFDSLVGHLTGGLAIVTVITCMFFGAISGSGPATTAAVGAIMVPTMVEKGYDKKFAMALVAASGCLGVIIPPSIPMVSYGISVNASIATMFMGGFMPGIILGLLLIITAVLSCKKHGFTGGCHLGPAVPCYHPGRHLQRYLHPHRGRRGLRGVCPAGGPVHLQRTEPEDPVRQVC